MRICSDVDSLRRLLAARRWPRKEARRGGEGFVTGLDQWDEALPRGCFRNGAVHELLTPGPINFPRSIALILARAAQRGDAREETSVIAWSDPGRQLYLPALAAKGIDPRRLILLRCQQRNEELWALAECLRCPGVCATVAAVGRLSRVEARRLQLAAEEGGGVGLLMRSTESGKGDAMHSAGGHSTGRSPATKVAGHYAAATRWLVQPMPGSDRAQRWRLQLLHGHGGQGHRVLLLEVDRETDAVRVSAALADRSALSPAQRATA